MSTIPTLSTGGQFIPSSAAPPAPPLRPESFGATPSVIPGVINFAQIDPGLFRGNQPTVEGFASLAQLGIHHDVDLRAEYDENLDMRPSKPWFYAYFPTEAADINVDQIATVVKTMMTVSNYPLYVHCLHGADRTGVVFATYRIVKDRWTNQAALNEMHTFGFHTQFTNLSSFISGLNADEMRARVDRASGLSFREIS